MILLAIILTLIAYPALGVTSGCTEGDGNIKTETRDLPSFVGIAVDGAFDVRVTCGRKQLVQITADANLLPLITTRVNTNILTIDTNRSICTKSDLLITVALPDIEQATVSGASEMTITRIDNRKFDLKSDGAGDISISGKTGLFSASLTGSTDLKARQLIAETVQISIHDAGEGTVYATQKLDAAVNGAASVTYFGNPKTVMKQADDAGEIVPGDRGKMNDEDEESE